MSMSRFLNRRQFLKTTSVATTALGAGVWISRAQTKPNSRINIGLIGTGDRAHAKLRQLNRYV